MHCGEGGGGVGGVPPIPKSLKTCAMLVGKLSRGGVLTHLHSEQPKEAGQLWKYFTYKSIFLKMFEGEMLIISPTKTVLQIFCELMLYSQVIFKSMKVADATF